MLFQLPVTALIQAIGVRNVSPPADSIKPFGLKEASKFLPCWIKYNIKIGLNLTLKKIAKKKKIEKKKLPAESCKVLKVC